MTLRKGLQGLFWAWTAAQVIYLMYCPECVVAMVMNSYQYGTMLANEFYGR